MDTCGNHRKEPSVKPFSVDVYIVSLVISFKLVLMVNGPDGKKLRTIQNLYWNPESKLCQKFLGIRCHKASTALLVVIPADSLHVSPFNHKNLPALSQESGQACSCRSTTYDDNIVHHISPSPSSSLYSRMSPG